jgi:hypothetical protein
MQALMLGSTKAHTNQRDAQQYLRELPAVVSNDIGYVD